jgi:subtilisin family serine protease
MGMVLARLAFDKGTVIVAATGNESDRPQNILVAVSVPAAAEGMVSVGAVGQKDGKLGVADFSSTMPALCAPGVAIRSATPGGGLATMSGTCMATPHVAGVAALWWEKLRALSPDRRASAADVIDRLNTSARQQDVFTSPYSRKDYGAGIVSVPPAV